MSHIDVAAPSRRNFDSRLIDAESLLDQVDTQALPDAVTLLTFLNRQPQAPEASTAIDELRRALTPLFFEIDRISIITNLSADLLSQEANSARMMLVEDAMRHPGAHEGVSLTEDPEGVDEMIETILSTFRRHGHLIDSYHPPITLSLHQNESTWLGTIFLWCDRNRRAPGQSTVDLLLAMTPYFRETLAGIIVRHGAEYSERHAFRNALEEMSQDCGLTKQEQRVLTFQLLGFSYKEIAHELECAENTVKKHLNAVHRKTDSRGFVELIAKYFSFLVVRDPKGPT